MIPFSLSEPPVSVAVPFPVVSSGCHEPDAENSGFWNQLVT